VQLEEEWIQSNPEWVPELELMIRKKWVVQTQFVYVCSKDELTAGLGRLPVLDCNTQMTWSSLEYAEWFDWKLAFELWEEGKALTDANWPFPPPPHLQIPTY